MNNRIPKIAIITNIIPSYRKGFYDLLFKSEDIDVNVFCQDHIKGLNIKCIHLDYKKNVNLIKFLSLYQEKLVWQFLPYWKILKTYDIIIIDGNPRILTHFLFSTLLRLTNKKIVIWSMLHSFRNNNFTKFFRLQWLKFFKYHLLYFETDIIKLKKYGFKNNALYALNNGLDQKKIDLATIVWDKEKLSFWQQENNLENKCIIISSGRLVNNKYDLLLDNFTNLLKYFPNLLWCIIGDGPDFKKMNHKAKNLNISEHLVFIGENYNDFELAPWFLSSKIFIHPYAVGLSIMHAFGFGLPIITHDDNRTHGPEFTIFKNGINGFSYKNNDPIDFVNTIVNVLSNNENLLKVKLNAYSLVKNQYNTDVMYNNFTKMINDIYKN